MQTVDKKFLLIDIDSGSEEVKKDVIKNSKLTSLEDMVLSYDIEESLVFHTQEEIKEAVKKLPPERLYKLIRDVEEQSFDYELEDEDIVEVMNILNRDALVYFYPLGESIYIAVASMQSK